MMTLGTTGFVRMCNSEHFDILRADILCTAEVVLICTDECLLVNILCTAEIVLG